MNKITLNKLIHNQFFHSSIIAITLIEILIFTLYSLYIFSQLEDRKEAKVAQVLNESKEALHRQSNLLRDRLNEIETLAYLIQQEHEEFFENIENYSDVSYNLDFDISSANILYKNNDNGGASLYYMLDGEPTIENYKKAVYSESLDRTLKSVVSYSHLVVEAFITTNDKMTRLYPYLDFEDENLTAVVLLRDFQTLLQEESYRGIWWTKLFYDRRLKTYMLSVLVPIYNQGKLEAISGLNIDLNQLLHGVLDERFASLLINNDGDVVAMNYRAKEYYNINSFSTINSKENPNKSNKHLLRSDNYKDIIKQVKESHKEVVSFHFNGRNSESFIKSVPNSQWFVSVIIDQEEITDGINKIKNSYIKAFLLQCLFLLILYFTFFYFLKKKAKQVTKLISNPIKNLNIATDNISQNLRLRDFEELGVSELDNLNRNFIKMAKSIEKQKLDLIEADYIRLENEEEVKKLRKISLTDKLTGLYNRYKVDEVLKVEVARFKRYKTPLSIMLIDIDRFKSINDNHGHLIGDKVLKQLAKLIMRNIREVDTAARFGGEEFIIILPDIESYQAILLAEKIRNLVEQHGFATKRRETISIGVAQLQEGESIGNLFDRCDKALYEAKNTGRNRVKLSKL